LRFIKLLPGGNCSFASLGRALAGHEKKMKQADRPDSVTTGCPVMTAIPLGRELLHGSSFLPARSASNINACLFGIAPGGGYRVSPFAMQASQRLVSVALFLALYLAAFGGRSLTVTLLCGVRTFLPSMQRTASTSGCLACFGMHCSAPVKRRFAANAWSVAANASKRSAASPRMRRDHGRRYSCHPCCRPTMRVPRHAPAIIRPPAARRRRDAWFAYRNARSGPCPVQRFHPRPRLRAPVPIG
jgi:hypothetical protein